MRLIPSAASRTPVSPHGRVARITLGDASVDTRVGRITPRGYHRIPATAVSTLRSTLSYRCLTRVVCITPSSLLDGRLPMPLSSRRCPRGGRLEQTRSSRGGADAPSLVSLSAGL